jgi:LPS O-antigen subunit length determinant protein (WzzB/FepE family)
VTNMDEGQSVNSKQPIEIERGDGIDVIAIVRVMWRYRYFVASVAILCALLAVVVALTAKEIFRAEVVVTTVHENGLSESGGLAGQLGGLASLAGVQLGGGGADASAQGVLASRHLVEEFVRTQNLVPQLTLNMGKRSTLWFAVKRFQDSVVTVHDDPLKGLTTVTMDWTDAATAAKWANDFIALANGLIRAHALEDAGRNVAYLNKQFAQTSQVEIQRSLSNLIESETKKLMLANGRVEFAFRIVDPAVAAEVRHSPRRTLLVISGTAIGIFLGTVCALGYNVFRRRKIIQ